MRKKNRAPPPSDPWKLPQAVTCYRCGKQEQAQRSFRLLPGSQQVIVCPECYQILLGRQACVSVDEDIREDGYGCPTGDERAPPDAQEEGDE